MVKIVEKQNAPPKSSFLPQQRIGMIVLLAFALITIARAQSGYSLFSAPEQKDWRFLYYAEGLNEQISMTEVGETQAEIARSHYFALASENFELVTQALQSNALAILMLTVLGLVARLFFFSPAQKTTTTELVSYLSAFLVSCVWIASVLRLRTVAMASIYAANDRWRGQLAAIDSMTQGIEHQQFRWTILVTLSCGFILSWIAYLQLKKSNTLPAPTEGK